MPVEAAGAVPSGLELLCLFPEEQDLRAEEIRDG